MSKEYYIDAINGSGNADFVFDMICNASDDSRISEEDLNEIWDIARPILETTTL